MLMHGATLERNIAVCVRAGGQLRRNRKTKLYPNCHVLFIIFTFLFVDRVVKHKRTSGRGSGSGGGGRGWNCPDVSVYYVRTTVTKWPPVLTFNRMTRQLLLLLRLWAPRPPTTFIDQLKFFLFFSFSFESFEGYLVYCILFIIELPLCPIPPTNQPHRDGTLKF